MIAVRIRGAAVYRPSGDLSVLVYAETPSGVVFIDLREVDAELENARDAEDEPR